MTSTLLRSTRFSYRTVPTLAQYTTTCKQQAISHSTYSRPLNHGSLKPSTNRIPSPCGYFPVLDIPRQGAPPGCRIILQALGSPGHFSNCNTASKLRLSVPTTHCLHTGSATASFKAARIPHTQPETVWESPRRRVTRYGCFAFEAAPRFGIVAPSGCSDEHVRRCPPSSVE